MEIPVLIPPTTSSKQKFLKPLIIVGLIVLVVVALFLFNQYRLGSLQSQGTNISAEESKDLVAQVGKLMDLPKNETPTVATVSDSEKLKDQPFFAKAQNGDKVLIYTKAKKAILYRPSINKIIEVAPINLDQNSQLPTPGLPNETPIVNSTPTSTPTPTRAATPIPSETPSPTAQPSATSTP